MGGILLKVAKIERVISFLSFSQNVNLSLRGIMMHEPRQNFGNYERLLYFKEFFIKVNI